MVVLALAAWLVPLHAAGPGAQSPADKTLSPYFFVDGGDPAVDRLPLKETRVDVAVTGVIAAVTVRQVYENRGARPIHARYVFPASTRAAVYGMTMTVGEVRIVARIREREKANSEFEGAKREGKSASLLEQSRPNVFTMHVANVLPGDTISVELKYTELLVPTELVAGGGSTTCVPHDNGDHTPLARGNLADVKRKHNRGRHVYAVARRLRGLPHRPLR